MDYHGALPKDSVAITGMAFQLPAGIDQCDKLWKFCKESRCAATPIPKHRFDADGFYHSDQSKAGYFHVHGGSFLEEDVASFDAPFFNISEPEARCMDPQQRLLLECTFQALTNAGMSIESIAGRQDVGVFAGGSGSEYAQSLSWDPYRTSRYAATGGAMSMFANRVSYFFGLRGPSQTIDTACSSSLVALHLAVESIRRGECSCAIVGGSFLQLSPAILTYMSSLG
jgi:acyl transferase domain-containing protein